MNSQASEALDLRGYRVCPDVNFQIQNGWILASNYRARRHILLNLPLFNTLAGSPIQGELRASDRTRFTNTEGLLADPTCLDRTPKFESVLFRSLSEAVDFLVNRFILIKDKASYTGYFARKRSIVDRYHFGTFHQQLGSELRLRERVNPSEWWYQQKFDPSTRQVRDNLYKFVQEAFLERYLDGVDLKGKSVLDFGCGSGMASRRFVARGAVVFGVDPDENLLAEASRAIGGGFKPVMMRLSEADPLQMLPEERMDLIWMADVLMFYFYPQDAGESWITPSALLRRLTANLCPEGRCVIMQPHGVFWLAPWLGDADYPYTVVSEYATRLYSVTPSLEDLSQAINGAGLAITSVYEPKPDPNCVIDDVRTFNFASCFPQWWVFECIKV